MRQNRVALVLGLLIVAAATAVWLALEHDQPPAVNVSNNVLNDDSPEARPLEDGLSIQPDTVHNPRGNVPTPPDDASPKQQDENDWLIKGRIVFENDVPAAMRGVWTEDAGIMVVYLRDGADPADARTTYIRLGKDLRFESSRSPKSFGHKPDDTPSPERWQVLFELREGYSSTLYDLDNIEETRLHGLVCPRVTGRVVDFGEVRIGIDAYVPNDHVVMGRLLHTSGRPLAYSGICHIWATGEQVEYVVAELRTDKDGSFSAPAELDSDSELRFERTGFYLTTCANHSDSTEDILELPMPTRTGRVLDFGEVKLEGALIECTLKSPMSAVTRPDGKPAFDRWGQYDGDHVEVELESNNSYRCFDAIPQPFTISVLVPEGRYVWSAEACGEGFYPLRQGILLARKGKVHRLEIDCAPFPSIPLEILADEGDAKDADVYWSILKGEEHLAEGSYLVNEAPRVPVETDCVTEVLVVAPGFHEAEATAKPGMDKLVVRLTRDASPKAKLVVLVPPFPAGLDYRYADRWGLHVKSRDSQLYSYCHVTWKQEEKECSFEFPKGGSYTLHIDGGERYGYPGGRFFGPIQIELTLGAELRYEIPAIPPPPWGAPISLMSVAARAGGNPINLNAWVVYEGLSNPVLETLNDGRSTPVRGLPLALKDDFDTYPVEFMQPIDGDVAELRIDFPYTVEVTVTRNGKAVPEFRATAKSAGEVTRRLECSTSAVGGSGRLWFPQGAARIEVEALGRQLYSKQHEITPGDVLRVNVAIDLVELTVECAGTDDPIIGEELPDVWRLEEPDGDQWQKFCGVSKSTVLTLEPGEYRFVPWNGSERDAVEVDLRDGEDRVVRLPDVEAPRPATVILNFDVNRLGEGWSDCEIAYQLTHHLNVNARDEPEGYWCNARIVPDGVKLAGVPLNAEIAIWGGLWHETPDDEHYLLLKPICVTVKEDGMLVDSTFCAAVDIANEWSKVKSRIVTGIKGLNMPLAGFAFAGRHEYEFYNHDGKFLLKDWITLPENSENPVKLPSTIRARLEALGAIEPAKGD